MCCIVTDVVESRLEMAKSMGADHVLKVEPNMKPEDVAAKVTAMLGDMPDRAIECSGAVAAIHTAIHVS